MSASLPNIVTAFSSVSIFYPISACLKQSDIVTFWLLSLLFFSCVISHLFASHKHGQIGFGCCQHTSKCLNTMDVCAAVMCVLRLMYLFLQTHHELNVPLLILCIVLNVVSEKASFGFPWIYAFVHSIWHVFIFSWMHDFIQSTAISS